jgi:putative DNA primase/helicase
VLRWDARDGARKEFWPATFWRDDRSRQAWKLKTWPDPRPLFGLDRLAKAPDAVVLLVEGEKKAVAVETGPLADAFKWGKRSVVGVSWPSGAKAIAHADFSPLAGRNVVIIPDNDKPGEDAASELVGILHDIGVRFSGGRRPLRCRRDGISLTSYLPVLTPVLLFSRSLQPRNARRPDC